MVDKIRRSGLSDTRAQATHKAAGPRGAFQKVIGQTEQASRERPRSGQQHHGRSGQGARGNHGISMLHAQRLAAIAPLIKQNAAKYGVPVDLICGLILQESGGNPKARSHVGATGLMQLMPATAKRMGVTDILNPAQNIEGGVKYLRYLLDFFKGDVRLALAGYNAGEGNVKKYGGIPPFKETQNYVPAVLSRAQSVAQILGSPATNPGTMRTMIRNTMPRHAVANFTNVQAPRPPAPESGAAIAHRLARM